MYFRFVLSESSFTSGSSL